MFSSSVVKFVVGAFFVVGVAGLVSSCKESSQAPASGDTAGPNEPNKTSTAKENPAGGEELELIPLGLTRGCADVVPLRDAKQFVMSAFKKAWPEANEPEYNFAEKCLQDALARPNAQLTAKQIEDICRYIEHLGKVVPKVKSTVPFATFLQTVQLNVYWYLTPPSLDENDVRTLRQQHDELIKAVSNLPQRAVEQFGAPPELKKEIDQLFAEGLADYKALLECPFLRISQVPMDPNEFTHLVQIIREEISTYGRNMKQELQENIDRRRRINSQRPKKRWLRRLPDQRRKGLLREQYFTCKSFATFFYGVAMRKFVFYYMDSLENRPDSDLYPFYQVTGYDFAYKNGVGWCFLVRPVVKIQEP